MEKETSFLIVGDNNIWFATEPTEAAAKSRIKEIQNGINRPSDEYGDVYNLPEYFLIFKTTEYIKIYTEEPAEGK